MRYTLKSIGEWIKEMICYVIAKLEHRHPYVLEGEKHLPGSEETILLYRIAGKRGLFEISAQELCTNDHLLSQFHPVEIRTIVYIAFTDYLLNVPEEDRKNILEKTRQRISILATKNKRT